MKDLTAIFAWLARTGGPVWERLLISALVTVAFTVMARWIRGVSRSGAVAGAAVCFVLYAGAGAGAFFALVTVFALTWITTHLGYQQKQRLGTAEKQEGRTASQVLANLGVAAACAGLYAAEGGAIFLPAIAAALSEAASDTVSSEVGQAIGGTARLITTWKKVPAGTDGGVTLAGTGAGILAAGVVSAVCAGCGLITWKESAITGVAGALGMVIDSFLGAWLERRGLLNNDWVNLLSTIGAVVVLLGTTILWR
ncbi:MAG TPA: DUF92 domain-containing protein [Terriglobales bacterium]|jgi:uncharacterized protein (TIGR00297 family)|nr:DUF92 domain-containing protein [Terriglobales bacterium]